MSKNVYNFDPQTGAYLSGSIADESPLEPGVFLFPAYATDLKPPEVEIREVPVFADGAWQIKSDWRGVPLFSIADGSAVAISEIGKNPADLGATELPSPGADHSWIGDKWALDHAKVALQQAAYTSDRLAKLRVVREGVLNRLSGIAGRSARQGDVVTADACDVAVQGLLDITKDLPADIDAVALEVLARYKTIVTTAAAVAPGLVSAFAGVDL